MDEEDKIKKAIEEWNAGIVETEEDKKRSAHFKQTIKELGVKEYCARIERFLERARKEVPPRSIEKEAELKAMVNMPITMTRQEIDSNGLRPVKVIEFFKNGRQDVREVPLLVAQGMMRAFSGTF